MKNFLPLFFILIGLVSANATSVPINYDTGTGNVNNVTPATVINFPALKINGVVPVQATGTFILTGSYDFSGAASLNVPISGISGMDATVKTAGANPVNAASGIAVADSSNSLQGTAFKIPVGSIICGIGDSLMTGNTLPLASDHSQAFLNLLTSQPSIGSNATIHNFGVGGTSSTDGARSGGTYATDCHPLFSGSSAYKILVIDYGSNDANGNAFTAFCASMEDIISRAQADGVNQIVVCTMLDRRNSFIPDAIPQFNDFTRSLPSLYANVKVFDISAMFPSADDGQWFNGLYVTSVDTSTGIFTVIQSGSGTISTGTTLTIDRKAPEWCDPLVPGVTYYAIVVDATHIKLATTSANATAGTAITIASTQAPFWLIVDFTHINAAANAVASQALSTVVETNGKAIGGGRPASQDNPNDFLGVQTFQIPQERDGFYWQHGGSMDVCGTTFSSTSSDPFFFCSPGSTDLQITGNGVSSDLDIDFDQNGATKIWSIKNVAFNSGAALQVVDDYNSNFVTEETSEGSGEIKTFHIPVEYTPATASTMAKFDADKKIISATAGTDYSLIAVQTGTLLAGTATMTVPSSCHPWAQLNATGTPAEYLSISVSGTTATITSSNPSSTASFTLFNAGSQ